MNEGLLISAYIGAGVLFILSLGSLSGQESAKRGIWYGMVGMAIAVVTTILAVSLPNPGILAAMVAVGAVAGIIVARRVAMTEMPQLVAALHSFVGLAAVLIGINAELELAAISQPGTAQELLTGFAAQLAKKTSLEIVILKVEVFLGVFIGAVTFTGSIVAFGKLAGKLDSRPRKLPGGHIWNAVAALAWPGAWHRLCGWRRDLDNSGHCRDRRVYRLASHHGHRRSRHAGGDFDAQLLFRAGRRRRSAFPSRTIS